jgi:hypothetical protein
MPHVVSPFHDQRREFSLSIHFIVGISFQKEDDCSPAIADEHHQTIVCGQGFRASDDSPMSITANWIRAVADFIA